MAGMVYAFFENIFVKHDDSVDELVELFIYHSPYEHNNLV